MLSYKTETRPGLVALSNSRREMERVYSYNPGACTGRMRDTDRESSTWLAQSVTCMVRPSCSMRCLPALVHGAGASSSRRSRYLHTMNPDLPLSGQYFTTYTTTTNNNNIKEKMHSEETQTLRAGCSKQEPKIFAPSQTTFPGTQDGQKLISCRWSPPSGTDPVW